MKIIALIPKQLSIFKNETRAYFFDYFCQTKRSRVVLNSEAEEYLWLSLTEIGKLEIEKYTKKAISLYLKRKTEEVLQLKKKKYKIKKY